MQCKEIQKKLSAYQDGEVKPDEEIIIRDHLKACSACQEQWQALHVMWKFVNTLPLSEPEPYFFTSSTNCSQSTKYSHKKNKTSANACLFAYRSIHRDPVRTIHMAQRKWHDRDITNKELDRWSLP